MELCCRSGSSSSIHPLVLLHLLLQIDLLSSIADAPAVDADQSTAIVTAARVNRDAVQSQVVRKLHVFCARRFPEKFNTGYRRGLVRWVSCLRTDFLCRNLTFQIPFYIGF